MKIVLDTNVLISALIKEGKPRNLLFEILRNHELVISREILEEVVIIANEPKIQKYVEQENIADFLRDLANSGSFVRIRSRFRAVKEDADDDAVLRTAIDGKASFIVSGDSHLLGMRRFRKVRIVTVAEMLRAFENNSI
ncbi:putative toxin-antitoxin system toxin component, PIN family [Nitrososphaera sp.]|uniref:putative toxin-antitoxin system toxin component, PIN family n=1 Tax=Nitrososphaera sp. TaxID=1971748 RepID=UPI0017D6ACB0|nr:putative toxin-antitoxin system toxin component, PIN family [Nitrososphaera sp.]NWG36563.1 putative toxin-antitoxin system toxin component, PIN family [Nitrososphaera sp.]